MPLTVTGILRGMRGMMRGSIRIRRPATAPISSSADRDGCRDFYQKICGAKGVLQRDPVNMKLANPGLILNVGGGPPDDKPPVTRAPPADPNRTSAFLNIRVADIQKAYKEWSARGVEFLTEPKDHGREIRAYIRDPDGHLIEVGQTTGIG